MYVWQGKTCTSGRTNLLSNLVAQHDASRQSSPCTRSLWGTHPQWGCCLLLCPSSALSGNTGRSWGDAGRVSWELSFPVCHVWGGRCRRGRSLLCDTEIALMVRSAQGIVRGTGDSFSLWTFSLYVLLARKQKWFSQKIPVCVPFRKALDSLFLGCGFLEMCVSAWWSLLIAVAGCSQCRVMPVK